MATPISEQSKAQFESVIPQDRRVTVKSMFGSLCGFINGNMFTGLSCWERRCCSAVSEAIAFGVCWMGAGLGLSITKAIVQAHQRTIEVKSREGEGSTFLIILPVE